MKLKERQRSNEQCAVCKDGPDGLVVCRGCSTLLHATCLIDVGGCPTIGCNEKDPLQEKAKPIKFEVDAKVLFIDDEDTFLDSLMEKREKEAFLNETIVCELDRCEEPTTRRERWCTLCMAEAEIWGDNKAAPGKTREQREQEIEDFRGQISDEDKVGFYLFAALVVVAILVFLVAFWKV